MMCESVETISCIEKRQVVKDKKYVRLLTSKDVKHAKLQVAKDEEYSQFIAHKDAEHDKIVTDLHEDFTDELHKSDAKVLAAVEQYQNSSVITMLFSMILRSSIALVFANSRFCMRRSSSERMKQ